MLDLTGVWVGKTTGKATKLHRWVILQRGPVLTFYTRYSGDWRFVQLDGCIGVRASSLFLRMMWCFAGVIAV